MGTRRIASAFACAALVMLACGSKNRVDVDVLGDAAVTGPPGTQNCQSCGGATFCLLDQCVMACQQDRDCSSGFRCLRTNAQGGCVPSTQSGCNACFLGGTVCTDNECRTSCSLSCAPDQFCRGNACYGTDPTHDPRGGNTSTGAGGGSGTGTGTGTGGQGGTGPSQCGPITEPCSHCMCTACPGDWQACSNDPSCLVIADCVRRTGCRTSCYRPDACQQVIDSNGGPSGVSFSNVSALVNCSMGQCQTACVSSGSPPTLGWWRFDEGGGSFTADASGNGHQGMLMNGPVWKPGIHGNAVALDGFSQFVRVSTGPIVGSSTSFTIEAWVNWPGAPGLMSIYSEGGGVDLLDLSLDNGMPAFVTYNGGTNSVKSGNPIPTFSWHHVVGVVQPGVGGTLYLDGMMIGSNPTMGAPNPGASETDIGRMGGSGTHFFAGAIDEVRAFSVSRSSQEILDDYRSMGNGP